MPATESKSENSTAFTKKGFSAQQAIRFFFASNAGLTILIIVLIIGFLLKEGLGFFPGYKRELEIYRITGMEYVDVLRTRLSAHEQLVSNYNRAYYAEINTLAGKEQTRAKEASEILNHIDSYTAPTRDKYFTLTEEENPPADVIESLTKKFKDTFPLALKSLPATPSLSSEERQTLIDAIIARPIDDENNPPLLDEINRISVETTQKFTAPLASLREKIDTWESHSSDLSSLVSDLSAQVNVQKEALQNADIIERDRKTLLAAARSAKSEEERNRLNRDAEQAIVHKPDTATPLKELLAQKNQHLEIVKKLHAQIEPTSSHITHSYTTEEAKSLQQQAEKTLPSYITLLSSAPTDLQNWNADKPVKLHHAVLSFLTGKKWVTGGEWQDFYGILPLLIGSLMIAAVALTIAIPAGIGAAIYTNQFASLREQNIIKPTIEFIQAIPSVVLGFIGIFVVGDLLREISTLPALNWIPGFPMQERLNIFNAGCLLALMSIPTIFTLAEDAINNVPIAYDEASESLGATRIQTTFRVIVPAASSGILAAVLLGFGRVIGETMVVLLVAGNRIQIPDFSAGIGAFFQPSHTMTGIIAQELGEVPIGSVHYRALFVVGIFLFAIVLSINALAHRATHGKKK